MKIVLGCILLLGLTASAQNNKFMWGVASASYQVEGAYQADGKGLSNWDVYTNKYAVTKAFTKTSQTANVSVNQYDRTQYLKDFALMKKLGVTHYRISLSWARILPNGIGAVNEKGIQHYVKFVDDLLSFGIEPCITLYHWDMPQALQEQGGWSNPKSVEWFDQYSKVVFSYLGKKVKTWITFNEPYIDLFLISTLANNVVKQKESPFATTPQEMAAQSIAAHHLLVANANTIQYYHLNGYAGQIGITLSLSPCIPENANLKEDIAAAALQDGMHNRWFLDATLKSTYPKDILDLYKANGVDEKLINTDDLIKRKSKPDFIGINFYAPNYVRYNEKSNFKLDWMSTNPDSIVMFNGPVRPEYLYKLLMRIKNEYNNPRMIITENGAGFGDRDEQLINGKVNDSLRTNYVQRHLDAALKAKKDGARLEGYFLWSILDNFEWLSGYDKRFGIVYVNFETQERIPKNSYYFYQKFIEQYKKKN